MKILAVKTAKVDKYMSPIYRAKGQYCAVFRGTDCHIFLFSKELNFLFYQKVMPFLR